MPRRAYAPSLVVVAFGALLVVLTHLTPATECSDGGPVVCVSPALPNLWFDWFVGPWVGWLVLGLGAFGAVVVLWHPLSGHGPVRSVT